MSRTRTDCRIASSLRASASASAGIADGARANVRPRARLRNSARVGCLPRSRASRSSVCALVGGPGECPNDQNGEGSARWPSLTVRSRGPPEPDRGDVGRSGPNGRREFVRGRTPSIVRTRGETPGVPSSASWVRRESWARSAGATERVRLGGRPSTYQKRAAPRAPSCASLETTDSPRRIACAAIIRSNGSRCAAGSVPALSASGPEMGRTVIT